MLKTLQVQGKDGRTAQQRARGNTGLQKRLNFGEEVCRYKARAQEVGIHCVCLVVSPQSPRLLYRPNPLYIW